MRILAQFVLGAIIVILLPFSLLDAPPPWDDPYGYGMCALIIAIPVALVLGWPIGWVVFKLVEAMIGRKNLSPADKGD